MFIFFRDYSTWRFIALGALLNLLYDFIFFLRVGKAERVFPSGPTLIFFAADILLSLTSGILKISKKIALTR